VGYGWSSICVGSVSWGSIPGIRGSITGIRGSIPGIWSSISGILKFTQKNEQFNLIHKN